MKPPMMYVWTQEIRDSVTEVPIRVLHKMMNNWDTQSAARGAFGRSIYPRLDAPVTHRDGIQRLDKISLNNLVRNNGCTPAQVADLIEHFGIKGRGE